VKKRYPPLIANPHASFCAIIRKILGKPQLVTKCDKSGLPGYLVYLDRDGVAVELDGIGTGGGEFEAVFEFGDFEGGLDGWISHNETGLWMKKWMNE
jgi:hypothetical protein